MFLILRDSIAEFILLSKPSANNCLYKIRLLKFGLVVAEVVSDEYKFSFISVNSKYKL
jgi:hypothetical protein